MKIVGIAFAVTAAAISLTAAELKVNDFSKTSANNTLVGWVPNCGKLQADSKLAVVKDEKGGNLYSVKAGAKQALPFYHASGIPVVEGTTYTITVTCKGKGRIMIPVYFYGTKNGGDRIINIPGTGSSAMEVTPEFKDYKYSFTLKSPLLKEKGVEVKTAVKQIRPVFQACSGSDVVFKSVKLESVEKK